MAGDIGQTIFDIRVRTPLNALGAAQGWSVECLSGHGCTTLDLARADLLIVQRAMSRRMWLLQRHMRRLGRPVIHEIDDLLTEVPSYVSNQSHVRRHGKWLARCLAQCDLVTVSTDRLGVELARHAGLAPPVTVPNYALQRGRTALPAQTGGPVTFVIASTERMAGGFIFEALRPVLEQGARLVVIGPAAAQYGDAGLPVQKVGLLPRAEFTDFVRSLPNPVALIPLELSRFASCKSAIKWFEYGEAGIPTVCSDASPYREVVESGQTGWLVCNESRAWQSVLSAVASQPAARVEVAQAARRVVRERHGLEHTVAALQRSVALASSRRAATTLPRSTLLETLQDFLWRHTERFGAELRRLNRARLARRKPEQQR